MNEIISVTKDGETYEAYVKSFSPSGKYFVGETKRGRTSLLSVQA